MLSIKDERDISFFQAVSYPSNDFPNLCSMHSALLTAKRWPNNGPSFYCYYYFIINSYGDGSDLGRVPHGGGNTHQPNLLFSKARYHPIIYLSASQQR